MAMDLVVVFMRGGSGLLLRLVNPTANTTRANPLSDVIHILPSISIPQSYTQDQPRYSPPTRQRLELAFAVHPELASRP
jgi:hypothetical protein